MAPAIAGSLEELKLRARSVRGHLTRFRTSLIKACDNLSANPSEWSRKEAEECFIKVKDQYDNLMLLYQECMALDDTSEDAIAVWEAKAKDVSIEMDASRSKINTALAHMDAAVQAANAKAASSSSSSAHSASPRVRVVDTLKPFVLSLQNTPVAVSYTHLTLPTIYSV